MPAAIQGWYICASGAPLCCLIMAVMKSVKPKKAMKAVKGTKVMKVTKGMKAMKPMKAVKGVKAMKNAMKRSTDDVTPQMPPMWVHKVVHMTNHQRRMLHGDMMDEAYEAWQDMKGYNRSFGCGPGMTWRSFYTSHLEDNGWLLIKPNKPAKPDSWVKVHSEDINAK